jgi:hypothetical protein
VSSRWICIVKKRLNVAQPSLAGDLYGFLRKEAARLRAPSANPGLNPVLPMLFTAPYCRNLSQRQCLLEAGKNISAQTLGAPFQGSIREPEVMSWRLSAFS